MIIITTFFIRFDLELNVEEIYSHQHLNKN